MTRFEAVAFLSALLLVSGCSRDAADWRPTMKNPPIADVPEGAPMTVPQMRADDIVVAVNGVALTKAGVDELLNGYKWMLSMNHRIPDRQRGVMYRTYGSRLVDNFVNTQAVLWDAREKIEMSEDYVRAIVESNVAATVKFYRMTKDQYDRQVPGGLNALRRASESRVWTERYTKDFITARQITDADVEAVLAQVSAENAEIAASNAVVKAKLAEIRSEIVKKGADFGAMADKYCEDPTMSHDGSGYWGTFRYSDIDDEELASRLYRLEDGEVSEILEDDEGYMIVKIADSDLHVKGTPERVLAFARIMLVKTPEVVLAAPNDLKKDLQQQENQMAFDAKVKELRNGLRIVYPHGTNFWKAAASSENSKGGEAK